MTVSTSKQAIERKKSKENTDNIRLNLYGYSKCCRPTIV